MADITDSDPSKSQPPPPPTGAEEGGTNDKQMPCFFRFFGVIVRIWGILTVAALSTAAWWLMTQRIDYPYTSWYTIAAAIAIGFLELIWFVEACVICRDNGGMCCTCWRLFIWIDYWRKTIIYVLIAIPEFVIEKPAAVPFVCGSLIVLLSILYLFKTCETCCGGVDERSSKRSQRSTQPTAEVKDTSKALMEEQPQ